MKSCGGVEWCKDPAVFFVNDYYGEIYEFMHMMRQINIFRMSTVVGFCTIIRRKVAD